MGLTEIAFNLLDNVSGPMSDMASNAESSLGTIESASESAANGLDSVGNAAENVETAAESVDGSGIDSVSSAADEAASSVEGLSSDFDELSSVLDDVYGSDEELIASLNNASTAGDEAASAVGSISSQAIDEAASAADALGASFDEAADSAEDAADKADEVGNSTSSNSAEAAIGAGVATAAVGALTAGLEGTAQQASATDATFVKMSSVKMPVEQVKAMIGSLVSATFPEQDAIAYVRTLKQIGLTSEDSLTRGARAFNTIQVGTGVADDQVVRFSNSMVAMGMDMNNIPASYNAIAYANANMVGGFQTYIDWMAKYDSTFHSMGLNIDQTAVLISAATKKFGGGRAAYSGLNDAIKASNGDLTVLEQQLGMQPGSLENASQATAAYSGKLESNRKVMEDHSTIMQKAQAEISKLSSEYSGIIAPLASFGGAVSGVITMGAGLVTMKATMATATSTNILANSAETGSLGVNTAATEGNILSKSASKVSSMASAAATGINAAALEAETGVSAVALGAAMAHTGAMEANTVATELSTGSRIVGAASYIGQSVAAGVATAAQWALNVAMDANPVMLVVIAIIALVAIFYELYTHSETVRNAVNALWGGLQALGAYIMGGLMAAWNGLMSALSPIIAALDKLWNALSNKGAANNNIAFKQITDTLHSLWTVISVVAGAIGADLIPVLNVLYPILVMVATFISGVFTSVWTTFSGTIMSMITFIATFINILADLVSGNISAGQAMQMIWTAFKTMIMGILTSVLLGIGGFALSLVRYGLNAATGFVNAIISWFMILPARVWMYLNLLVARILMWKTLAVAYAQQAGSQLVSRFISFITSLPGRAWIFLLNTVAKIVSFAGQAASSAGNAGSQIVQAIASYLTSLPGQMYQWGQNAIQNFVNAIVDSIPGLKGALQTVSDLFPHSPPKAGPLSTITDSNLYKWAQGLGTQLKQGVDEGSKDMFSNVTDPSKLPIPATQTIAQPAAVTASAVSSAGVNLDVPGLQAQTIAAQGIVTANVTSVTGQYNLLKTNTGSAWTSMVNTQKTSLTSMKNNMATTLKGVVDNNTATYQKIQNTTTSTLSNLKSQTTSSMANVKTSWSNMKDSLTSAANTIQTNVNSDINSLSSNIGTFYGKIQNPALFLGGMDVRTRPTGRLSIPSISGTSGKFFAGHTSNKENIRLLNMGIPLPCTDPNGCFSGYAGWTDLRPNTSDIIDKVDTYIPNFTPYGSLNTTVGSFTDSSFPITGNLEAFRAITENMIGKTSYQFYTNSKGGSLRGIYESGSFNCWDGANIMLAMAGAFGLGGYMQHGTWNGIPHVWAVIGGETFDTTAFQDGYGWTSPKVSGYTAPAAGGGSFKSYAMGELNTNYGSDGDDSFVVSGKLELVHVIDMKNVPANVDKDEITAIFEELVNDPTFINGFMSKDEVINRLNIELARRVAGKKRRIGAY